MRIAMVSAVIVALAGSIDDAAPQHPAYPMPTGTPNLPTDPNLTRPLPLDPARPYFLTVGKLMRVGTGLAGDGIFLTLDVDTTNNTCQIKSGLHMDRTHPQYRETVSIALLALAQARPIEVYHFGDCWPVPSGQLVNLSAIAISTGH